MREDTARMLVDATTNSLGIAIDNRNKLVAFEKLLEKHRPELFEEYKNLLQQVRRNPPTEISAEGLANLYQKLITE